MSEREALQRESRARIRAERNLDPHYADLGDGAFALHIQYGGNALIANVGPGSGDQEAFREWLDAIAGVRLTPAGEPREGELDAAWARLRRR